MNNIAHLTNDRAFTFVNADVIDPINVEGQIDGVLALASPASPIDYAKLPLETLRAGTFGTYHAVELALLHRAKFLLASTSEVYGDPAVHPQKESYWGNVNPIGPRAIYDEAKRVSETYATAYQREFGLDIRIVRIFNTYGPRMRADDGRAIPAFLSQALAGEPMTVFGDGSQTRSLCYVEDLISGIEKLWDSDYTAPVNIGNPQEITMLELANVVRELTKSKSVIEHRPLPTDDPTRRRPDITIAREVLKWEPTVSLETGLLKTIETWPRTVPVVG
jgi:dTDP-glucose 4,6-dehydratase